MEYFAFGETFLEEHSNTETTPYLFNGKELDEETGLYYYGARYYSPREQIWASVDPLALYDPVKEDEHYLDGEHNGGVFYSGNLAAYSYTYQNPIRYIDPNGKQVDATKADLSKIINVTNVLQGKKWIDYQTDHPCGRAARMQNNQVSNANPAYDGSQINMHIDKSRQDQQDKSDKVKISPKNTKKGIETIIKNLKNGKPVMVGVNYKSQDSPGNDNVATDHYINIVGMGKDNKGRYYFSYYDNFADPTLNPTAGQREKVGTNLKLNRLFIGQNSQTLYDGSPTTLTGPNHAQYGNIKYIVTEVKPNQ